MHAASVRAKWHGQSRAGVVEPALPGSGETARAIPSPRRRARVAGIGRDGTGSPEPVQVIPLVIDMV
jgi:hypothetical protein